MKKRALILLLAFFAITALTAFAGCNKKTPEPTAGTIYKTKTESFWMGVGNAYITFEYEKEPEDKTEESVYGYVFNVMVSSGGDFESWLKGTWELSEENGVYGDLTLTASWDASKDNITYLADAESGEKKTYKAVNGKYTIGINLPSAGNINFTLDPAKDKVGDGNVSDSSAEKPIDSSENVQSGTSEKEPDSASQSGDDSAEQGEATIAMTLAATSEGGQSAKIELDSEKNWTLSISYYQGGEYTPTASGRWAMNELYNIDLIVTGDSADVLAEDSYTLFVDYATQKFSGTMVCNIPVLGEVTFDFVTAEEGGGETEATVQTTLNATSAGGQKAKIELLSDNSWELSIKYWDGGDYMFAAGGTWELSTVDYNITLTASKDDADVLANETYLLNIDYITFNYGATIVCNIPQLGEITFNFTSGTEEGEHFTVSYDLNYDGAPAVETATTTTFDGGDAGKKEYLKDAPADPVREGYAFAGWYTERNVTLVNGVSDKQYLFGTKLSAYNSAPASIQNDVMEITGNTTLYARWVTCREISTAEELKDMANDMNGWYKLTADITLEGEWSPIGGYYFSYEFYEPAWWLHSFHGILDGNGHSIKGLTLSKLTFADDAFTATEGSGNGTTALFASAVNCTVKNLVIDGADIRISDYKEDTHVYVSAVAAFVQGGNSLFENVTVRNSAIEVSCKDSWYIGVAGLFAGHWGGQAINCSVENTSITVNPTYTKVLDGKPYEAVYVGALVGEGYTFVTGCSANADVTLSVTDQRSEAAVPMNVYFGGATASSTYLDKVSYEGTIALDYDKAAGDINVYFGGVTGYQRYGYIRNCYSKAAISLNDNGAALGGEKAVGGILGSYDTMYALMGAAYFYIPGGDRVTNCLDNSTYTGNLEIIGSVPADYMLDAYNAAFGVDLSEFKRADGSYTFLGAFNCVKIRSEGTTGTDMDGNVTVTSEEAAYGEALKETLGDGWTYANGELPTL